MSISPTFTPQRGIIAWTGGSTPAPLDEVHPLERALVDAIFAANCAGFRAFWGREPDAGVMETYLITARYDAHATVREGGLRHG